MFRLGLKFVVPLLVLLALLAWGLVPLTEAMTLRWFQRDLSARARLVANTIESQIEPLLVEGTPLSIRKAIDLLNKVTLDERLLALAVCDTSGNVRARTTQFPEATTCRAGLESAGAGGLDLDLASGPARLSAEPLRDADAPQPYGWLLVLHDTSHIVRRARATRAFLFLLFVCVGAVVSGVTVVVARWTLLGWVRSVRGLLLGARKHETLGAAALGHAGREFLPIMKDLKSLVRDLEARRTMVEEAMQHWTPRTLKELLAREFAEDEVIVVSNRQPYIHKRNAEGEVEVQFPASGLVTAVEPIVRACSGVWVAHGNGDADAEVVDARGRVSVPPGKPQYEIHRIWLTKEEEQGFYYGFSNEGLWPLCHIAHTRPVFRTSDWETYKAVNETFARAVAADAKTDDPVVLVQDYHFALLPKMLRELLPNATIITFWHIPWPNAESFGICPWREQILEGLLGSSIVGFHTQYHCNNFIETVDRYLESRLDRESASISYHGKVTSIKPYPISIEWPPRWQEGAPSLAHCRSEVLARHGFPHDHTLGIGVDRLDYTKGIVERLLSVERLMELHPEWLGRFTFIQIAAPSRSSLPSYRNFDAEVRETAARINERFSQAAIPPILLLVEHHEPQEVLEYYRACEVCFITSLHDGMNLVGKEYVAARDDDTGVLIMSMFAGASRELSEALIINPYNIDECAEALAHALSMPLFEQKERMRSMRSIVREFNVYRWAARMLIDAAAVRRKNRILQKTGTWGINATPATSLF